MLLAELEQADEYVFGVPMHNFGVPSVLKLWIDQIARVGRTFPVRKERRKDCSRAKRRRSSSRPGGYMTRRLRCPHSTLSSRICGRSLASSV
nr:NAD(P)H-dependent oxidoreductase [Edaphobacter aggregans]